MKNRNEDNTKFPSKQEYSMIFFKITGYTVIAAQLIKNAGHNILPGRSAKYIITAQD